MHYNLPYVVVVQRTEVVRSVYPVVLLTALSSDVVAVGPYGDKA